MPASDATAPTRFAEVRQPPRNLMTAMNFLFRKPRFPIIVNTGTGLIGAKSWAACERQLATVTFADMAPRDVIDSSVEGFFLFPEHMVFSPLTLKKRWTKAAIIDRYNCHKEPGRPEYPTKSLGNKSLEKVFGDIVELLTAPRKVDGAAE
jgi:hypothetical protein